jgi:SAM-dependent methyltransferase
VGIDFSILAVWLARLKARRLGTDCRFYRADVTDLSFLEGPFDLALDIGCLHSVPVERWKQYARGVNRLVRPGGFFLLYAFTPRPGQGDPRGVAFGEVTELFTPAFAVERREEGDDPTGPSSAWYWLRRMSGVQFRL